MNAAGWSVRHDVGAVWHARLGTGCNAMVIVAGLHAGMRLDSPAFVMLSICGALNRLRRPPEGVTPAFRAGDPYWLRRHRSYHVGAHIAFHLATGWNAFWPVEQRSFPGRSGKSRSADVAALAHSLQILLLDAGLLLTLYTAGEWRGRRPAKVRARHCLVSALGSCFAAPVCGGNLDSVPTDADARNAALNDIQERSWIGAACRRLYGRTAERCSCGSQAGPFQITLFSTPSTVESRRSGSERHGATGQRSIASTGRQCEVSIFGKRRRQHHRSVRAGEARKGK